MRDLTPPRAYDPAPRVSATEYILSGDDIYDPEVEEWEFLPGARVRVEEQER